jgi:flagellar hook-associated protein FlgK
MENPSNSQQPTRARIQHLDSSWNEQIERALTTSDKSSRESENFKALFQVQHASWLANQHTKSVLHKLKELHAYEVNQLEELSDLEKTSDREIVRRVNKLNQLSKIISLLNNYENFI